MAERTKKMGPKAVARAVNDIAESFDRACLVALSSGIRLGELELMLRASFARSERARGEKQEMLPTVEK